MENKPKQNKIRVNVMVDPDINEKLAKVAKLSRMSKSQFINNALEDLLEGYEAVLDAKNFGNANALAIHFKNQLEKIKLNFDKIFKRDKNAVQE